MPGLMARKMAGMGRYGDTELVHATPGETVVPTPVLNQPGVRRGLGRAFDRAGLNFGRYEIGGRDDSINPATGLREYYADPGMDNGMDGTGASGAAAADTGGGWGDAMDSGPVSSGFSPDQYGATEAAIDAFSDNRGAGTEAARTASAAAMVGDLRDRGWSSEQIGDMLGVQPDRIGHAHMDLVEPARRTSAQGWLDALRTGKPPSSKMVGQALTAFTPLGPLVSLGDMLTNMAVQRGWNIDYDYPEGAPPGVGGDGMRRPETTVPKNGLAPSTPRGVYTPPAPTGEPLYMKYMQSPEVA